jgi:hypothetical protein
MKKELSLLGSWIQTSDEDKSHGGVPSCIWHVIDNRTCVYEIRTDIGIVTSWFQYWPDNEGILQYPLSKTTRSTFKLAQRIPIELKSEYLVMNGYRFERAKDLPIPPRNDLFPGTRPDENGHPIPTEFKSDLQDYVSDPPRGEQDAASNGGNAPV